MRITAISIFDNCLDATNAKGAIEVVLVILDFQPRLMTYIRVAGKRNVIIFAVDQWIFERDIERGFLGEASAGTLIFPHVAIEGERYLHSQEIKLKKRLILELLENLVLSFPELSDRIRIKPEYFMYEAMLNRVRIFPPLTYCASNFVKDLGRKDSLTLATYCEALRQLENDKQIIFPDDFVMIPRKFVTESNKNKIRLTNISKNAPRTIFTSIFETFPQLLNFLSKDAEKGLRFQRLTRRKSDSDATRPLVDPLKYVFVPTSSGLVSIADRVSVEDLARKFLLNNEKGNIVLKPIGSVLNDVYMVEASLNGAAKRLLIKRYKDWSGVKWFPLNIWAFGARTFAVLGRSRLERECVTSELLRKEGFNVPKILHVSHSKRLIFMEYIEGENLSIALKRIALQRTKEGMEKDLATIVKVGEIFARVHSLDVALGDTKPENIIIDTKERVYLLDFEQASIEGDKIWDIAEFLLYSGHYLSPLQGNTKAQAIAEAFIRGYLNAGGNSALINKAGSSKYTRVFSIFTMPSIIRTMSNSCKKLQA